MKKKFSIFMLFLFLISLAKFDQTRAITPGSGVSIGIPVALVGFVGAGFAVYQMFGSGQTMSLTQFTNAAAQAGEDVVSAGGLYEEGLTTFIINQSASALGVNPVQFKAFLSAYQSPDLTASSSLSDRLEQVVLDAKNAAYKVSGATLAQQEVLSKQFLQNQVSRFINPANQSDLPPQMGSNSNVPGEDSIPSQSDLEQLVVDAQNQENLRLQSIEEADTSEDDFLSAIKAELQDATEALDLVIKEGGMAGDEAYELAKAKLDTVDDYISSKELPIVD